ncbi:MAG: AEC family transporter, partial [Candidatus Eisenbacteria bacterium]|nr:AEC family transporter [Candidatus Eisenbacteria bacterium]
MLSLFVHNLLPVFLTAGAGWLLAALLKTDARPLAQVGLYVLAPGLILDIILQNALPPGELLRMMGFSFAALALPGLAAFAVARLLRWPRTRVSALVLACLLTNAGNYGMSVNLLAFSEKALPQASLFFLASAIVSYTAGIFVASMGRTGLRASLVGLLRVPTVWAVALAFSMNALHLRLPAPAATSVHLLSQACIPVFLLVLVMQLRGARLSGPVRPLAFATALRLAGGAAAGALLAPLFGLTGVARQAGILQSAMPTAVLATILATEYDVEPGFVTSVVLLTTILSPLTLTPLLA